MTLRAISPLPSVDIEAASEQRPQPRGSPPSAVSVACEDSSPEDDRRIQEWLLRLLRFAITLDAKHEASAIAIADELDGLGLNWRPAAPTFFRRTSGEVCKAIATPDDPGRTAVLKTHCARIANRRLQRAFEAAIGLDESARPHRRRSRAARTLWIGLKR